MTEAAKQNAIALRDAAIRDAPRDSGELEDTIKYYPDRNSAGLIWRVVAGVKASSGFYARYVEFGTVDQPAHPFFFVNYRILRPRFKSRMARAMRKGIKEA
jgi:HK97 gp10 family phage protein